MWTYNNCHELYHFGVKGMRWGVIHEDEKTGRHSGSNNRTGVASNRITANSIKTKKSFKSAQAKKAVRIAEQSLAEANRYGDETAIRNAKKQLKEAESAADSLEGGKKKLTTKQKVLIGAAVTAGVLVVGGAIYVHHKNGSSSSKIGEEVADKIKTTPQFLKERVTSPAKKEVGTTKAYTNFMHKYLGRTRSLESEWPDLLKDPHAEEPIFIKKGTVLKRISTEHETEFLKYQFGGDYKPVFASFKEDDVTRYKAVLPFFFEIWGTGDKTKYVNKLEAITDIKSPSKKVRVNILADMLASGEMDLGYYSKLVGQDYTMDHLPKGKEVDRIIFSSYYKFAQHLNMGASSVAGESYLNKLTKMGYNAIVDDNNSGLLSDSPMIFFMPNKTLKRVGADVLTPEEIKAAREVVKSLF